MTSELHRYINTLNDDNNIFILAAAAVVGPDEMAFGDLELQMAVKIESAKRVLR